MVSARPAEWVVKNSEHTEPVDVGCVVLWCPRDPMLLLQLLPESTATVERMIRPHRPHAPRGRKHTPETLSAVRCALSQLQGEPAPPMPPDDDDRHSPEPG
ncbi:unnamed protein product [Arctia plantaginis]|nr:unnamed protein product [Arctia plantaginis]